MTQVKVRHTRRVDIETDYIVESDDEFFTEDEAVDAVIHFFRQEELPKGVKVTVKQVDEVDYDEDFESEIDEEDE